MEDDKRCVKYVKSAMSINKLSINRGIKEEKSANVITHDYKS